MTVYFQDTKDADKTIKNIIDSKSAKTLVMISPFWDLETHDLERLKRAGERNKKITIVVADKKKWYDKNRGDTLKQLSEIKGVKILEAKNTHAKCYYNEFQMVLTSMNYNKISRFKNSEMGVTFNKKDKKLFEKAKDEAELIIKYATPIIDRNEARPSKKFKSKKSRYSKKPTRTIKKKTTKTRKKTTRRKKKPLSYNDYVGQFGKL